MFWWNFLLLKINNNIYVVVVASSMNLRIKDSRKKDDLRPKWEK